MLDVPRTSVSSGLSVNRGISRGLSGGLATKQTAGGRKADSSREKPLSRGRQTGRKAGACRVDVEFDDKLVGEIAAGMKNGPYGLTRSKMGYILDRFQFVSPQVRKAADAQHFEAIVASLNDAAGRGEVGFSGVMAKSGEKLEGVSGFLVPDEQVVAGASALAGYFRDIHLRFIGMLGDEYDRDVTAFVERRRAEEAAKEKAKNDEFRAKVEARESLIAGAAGEMNQHIASIADNRVSQAMEEMKQMNKALMARIEQLEAQNRRR